MFPEEQDFEEQETREFFRKYQQALHSVRPSEGFHERLMGRLAQIDLDSKDFTHPEEEQAIQDASNVILFREARQRRNWWKIVALAQAAMILLAALWTLRNFLIPSMRNVEEQIKLGRSYEAAGNYNRAAEFYRLAASRGYDEAVPALANVYLKQEEILFQSAEAQFSLGLSYEKGEGISQSFERAAEWYHRAAQQGDIRAQVKLGLMYAMGLGVLEDAEKAKHWYSKAKQQNEREAAKYSDVYAKEFINLLKSFKDKYSEKAISNAAQDLTRTLLSIGAGFVLRGIWDEFMKRFEEQGVGVLPKRQQPAPEIIEEMQKQELPEKTR